MYYMKKDFVNKLIYSVVYLVFKMNGSRLYKRKREV